MRKILVAGGIALLLSGCAGTGDTALSQPQVQMIEACRTWASTKLTMAALINADVMNPTAVAQYVPLVNGYCETSTPPTEALASGSYLEIQKAIIQAQAALAAQKGGESK